VALNYKVSGYPATIIELTSEQALDFNSKLLLLKELKKIVKAIEKDKIFVIIDQI